MAIALAVALVGLITESASSAVTFTVKSTGTAADANPGNGVCANRAGVCTLRAAIHEANALSGPDTIQLPAGTYPISPPATQPNDILTGDLDITDDLTIQGAGSPSTIITGGLRDRVFEVSTSGDVAINDLTIRSGSHPQVGAGIMNAEGGTVTVTGSVLQSNKAAKFGGGVANAQGGSVRLLGRTRLSANSAGEAGSAVANLAGGTIEITQSTVSGNSSALGGAAISNTGVTLNAGTITLSRATLANNVAGSGSNPGGGISNAGDGNVLVDRSQITGNRSAAAGGGIANSGRGTVEVKASTISGNKAGAAASEAEADGGGISNSAGGTLTVSASTISNNTTTGEGGGIRSVHKGALTVTNSTFSGNSALDGGAIYSSGDRGATITGSTLSGNIATRNGGGLNNNGTTGGALTVEDVTFSANKATDDGGGLILEGGAATIADSDFADNSAASGGGFANHSGGVVTLTDATFTGNIAQDQGGGIDNNADGTFTLLRILVSGNQATQGGGIDSSSDAAVTLTHSQISGNEAERGGGLASNMDASDVLENTTISGNTATVEGGGVLVLAPLTLASTTIADNSAPIGGGIQKIGDSRLFLRNTIVANNPGGNCGFERATLPIESQGGNLDSGITCGLSHPTDLSGADPLLGPLQDNGGPTQTHALDPTSPALDRAVAAHCPATDQRGVARPQHLACDSGAYELEGPISPPPCVDPGATTVAASRDTWINQLDPAKNFGLTSQVKVRTGPSANSRVLVGFELPAIPSGCRVVDAVLRLEAGGGTEERTLEAIRLASGWSEALVTWNDQPATIGAAATAPSGKGTVQWNVTSQVTEMYSAPQADGFMIRDAVEDDLAAEQSFYSREAGKNPPPQLVVSFG